MSRISAAVFAVALGLCLALGAGEASASHVSCGDVITADTTLDSDLVDCPNNGLVIGADDVTLDLNGHVIDGDGTDFAGCGKEEICDVGVLNDGHSGVTVRDGSMRQFWVGDSILRARGNRVRYISSSRNRFFGLLLFRVARSVIRDSSGRRNIAPDGDGMGLFDSRHVRIVDSSFRHNPGPGIHVGESNENVITGNVFSHNGPAILIQGDRNQVRHNRVVGGGGILVPRGDRNMIARNRIKRSDDSLAIENGRGNLVTRNLVVRARGEGIRLGIGAPPIGGAKNVIRRNLVRSASDDGFLVTKNDGHSVLRRNVAVGAGDDGFDIRGASTKLTRNRALRNAALGINAVRAVIDGGGNKAHGNGNPAQCENIVCD